MFKKALIDIGADSSKHLHSIRHTFAVRRWAITGDIKMVSQEIGHSSVVMTEKYTKFNLRLTPPSKDKYLTTLLNAI